jgi:hypothetical protein
MYPTSFPELNGVLDELVHRMQAVMGTSFVGLYLQGSFAVGDADEHSDVDWVAVVESEPNELQVNALQHMHASVFGLESSWAQYLEGSYFPRDVLRDSSMAGGDLWYLDNGASVLVRSSHCNTVLVRWIVREMGVPVAGPPPASLVDPVSVGLLREYIASDILDWGQKILDSPSEFANEFYQKFIALNYARMLHDLYRGRPGSKHAGAEWAKTHLDPAWIDLLDSTWEGRTHPEVKIRQPADPVEFDKTLSFVRYVMDECRRYMSERGTGDGSRR